MGEVPAEFEARPIRQAPTMMDDAEPEPTPRRTKLPVRRMAAPLLADAPQYAPPPAGPAAQPGFQLGHVADDGSKEAPPGATHSSGVFLALFFFVAIAFFGLAAFICGEPAASVDRRSFDFEVACRAIQIPVHVIRGRLSELVSLAAAQAFVGALANGSLTDVSDAGHMVAGDRNDVFADAVLDFLTRHANLEP